VSEKETAREYAGAWLRAGRSAMIRVNGTGTAWHKDDIALVDQTSTSIMMPKAERSDSIERLAPGIVVVALVETAAGISEAAAVCSATGVHRVAFGSVDLAAQLGIDPSDREALLVARSTLVLASAAAGLAPPIDGVTTALTDRSATADDVMYARRLGLTGKLCIHPSQIPAVHEALTPSADEVAWARKVAAAWELNDGASAVEGHMVDLPILHRARSILDVADRF